MMGRVFQRVLLISGVMLVAIVISLVTARHDTQSHVLYYREADILYKMNPDGSQKKLVLADTWGDMLVSNGDPSWGLMLVNGTDERSLYRVHPNGRLTRRLVTIPKDDGRFIQVMWSADGEWIVYSTMTSERKLYQIRPNGRDHYELLRDADFSPHELWYFEGNWLVLNVSGDWGNVSTYRLQLDTGELERTPQPDGTRFRLISPDDRWIVFYTRNDLYRITAEGMDITQLTDFRGSEEFQTWSPNSEWIYFSLVRDLYRMRWNGEDVQRITKSIEFRDFGLWSPDGEWIYYVGTTDVGPLIVRSHPNGDKLERLTDVSLKPMELLAWTVYVDREWNIALLFIVSGIIIGGGLCLAYFNSRS